MWNKLSIKLQLIVSVSFIIFAVEASTLYLILNLQKKETQEMAVNEANSISASLNNDFLKYLFSPSADALADISYRLSAFQTIAGAIVIDENNQQIYQFKDVSQIQLEKNSILSEKTMFTDTNLLTLSDIEAEGYRFGSVLLKVDLEKFQIKQKEITFTILAIFPFALLFGLALSLLLSKSYTNPFLRLLSAMRESDPTNNQVVHLETQAQNEIKELFKGFNAQMAQISDSTKELKYQANHDQLTKLYNRFYIETAIQAALNDEDCCGYNLYYLDLDQFKLINDSAGYQAGDQLLTMIANHYQAMLPEQAIFARVDGNGFMVLIKDCGAEFGTEFLTASLERLSDFRFCHKNETYSVSASISYVYFKPFEYTLKEILKVSSAALYTAKSKGRNKSHIYDPSDDKIKRVAIEAETAKLIKEALGSGPARFELYAQDIIALQTPSDMLSYEILIRMWDKDNNFISPGDFLPAAERYQLMADIDAHVLWTYLETVTANPEHIQKLHSAHINLAGSSLNNPDFQAKVKEAIAHFNFPWHKLELEITESSAIGSFNSANQFIAWLKDRQIGLALDDFGTGMASFEYLKSMPFDVVKIDGSFVKDMHKDPTDKAVIKYIQEIADLKGQETVAEYVETQQDVDALTALGVTYGQGFFLGKPRPLTSWME
ncbi:EAL domain-containing protein [Marinomonas epiphytica]